MYIYKFAYVWITVYQKQPNNKSIIIIFLFGSASLSVQLWLGQELLSLKHLRLFSPFPLSNLVSSGILPRMFFSFFFSF